MLQREVLRMKERRGVLEVRTVDDRNLSVGRRGQLALIREDGAVLEAKEKDAARVGALVLEASGAAEGLRQ